MAKEIKKYVLLENQHPQAPVSILVDKSTRVRMDRLPAKSAYLQTVISTEDGQNKVLRLKLQSNHIYQDEQIKEGILANEKFSNAERAAVKFVNGELYTDNATVIKFLDNHPQNEAFKGFSVDELLPIFKHYDEKAVSKGEISAFKKQLKAANLIDGLTDLKEAQDMIIRIRGSYHAVPTELNDAKLELVDIMEDVEGGVDLILKEEKQITSHEKASILVGRLLASENLSFNVVPKQVSVKRLDKWEKVIDIGDTANVDEVQGQLVAFLLTPEGESLHAEFKEIYASIEAPESEGKKGGAKK